MFKKIKKFLSLLGPGFITGAADDDPSGIATYSQTGALFGFTQLWTALFSFPMMACVQEMCGRIGVVTKKGLTTLIKEQYSRPVLYLAVGLLSVANIFNIGADLGAMAAAIELITPIPFYVGLVIVAVVTLLLEIFIPYKTYARYLKYLTFALFAYIITAFFITVNWLEVIAATLIPSISFSKEYIMNIAAIFGTTISPYLFFWQTNQEVEERLKKTTPIPIMQDLKEVHIDTMFGMFFSNLIMWFIIITTGATLCKSGICTITTAHEAALALRPFAGDYAFLLFSLGIIGTGLLAVPVLAGSVGYAVSQMMEWPASLSYTYHEAKKFYRVIIATIIIGIAVNIVPVGSITLLYYSAIFNGLIAPILIIIIMGISNNKQIMGLHTNSSYSRIMGVITCTVMGIIAIALIFSWFL